MSKKARAAVVYEPEGRFTIEDVELDDLHPGEAYIKIEAVGVCHTDMNMQPLLGMPAVVGHEGTGIVEEVAAGVDYVKPGDRVIISWPTCGKCPKCLIGRIDLCEMQFPLNFGGRRADGTQTIKLKGEWIHGSYFQQSSFATHAIAPVSSLVKVDDGIPPEVRAAMPCGIMTGAGSVINAFSIGPKDDLVVFGAGAVGLSAVMAAKVSGAYPLVAVDVQPQRLELAKELGATHAFNAREDDVVASLAEIRPAGFKYAIDTSAKQSSISRRAQVPGDRGDLRRAGRARAGASRLLHHGTLPPRTAHAIHPGGVVDAAALHPADARVVQAGPFPGGSSGRDVRLRADQRGLGRIGCR